MATVNEILAAGLRLVQQPQTTFKEAADSDPDPNETFKVASIDNSPLKVGEIIQLKYGKVAVLEDGSVYYKRETELQAYKELAQGETGVDSIPFEVKDSGGLSAGVYAITFNIQGRNDAPEANDDVATTDEDKPVNINVLANDKDVDGDTIKVAEITEQPKHGTATINADGTVKYTPTANYHGTDSFVYKIVESDPAANTDTAKVTITVNDAQDPPVATDDKTTTAEDKPVTVNVLANDSDPDGDTITVTKITVNPAHGTATLNADGTITYKPNADFNGKDTLKYEITDGHGNQAQATLEITVTPENDAPIANDDAVTLPEDNIVSNIPVLANDVDPDGDKLTVTKIVTGPEHGTATLNADGTINYQPNANYNGSDSLVYEVTDGKLTDTATLKLTVTPVNDRPVAVDDRTNTLEDTPVTHNVLANDTDPENDPLTVTRIVTAPTYGTATINADGTITYTPGKDFVGTDSLLYEISDGKLTDTGVFTIDVAQGNDAPTANDDSVSMNEDTIVTVGVLGNDTDPENDPLTVTKIVNQPTHGTAILNADGTITYTPGANYNGSDSLVYEITDGEFTDTATVTFNVKPTNDAPNANDDSTTTKEDTAKVITVLANDTDPDGDTLTVTKIVNQPTHGTAVLNADGTITYTPNSNYHGNDVLTYEVSDGKGGSDTATVNVIVEDVNDAPNANDDTTTTKEDTAKVITVLANDTDPDGDTLTVTKIVNGPGHGTATVNTDGTVTYTPTANYNGNDTLTYEVSDGKGGTDTATVSITVDNDNDGPNANDDSVTTNEDVPATVNVLTNDTDPDGDKLIVTKIVNGPGHGTATINTDGTVTYTPTANYNGGDTLTYEVSDGKGGTDTAKITFDVKPVNDAPDAKDDAATTDEGKPVTINVLANDTDIDGDALSVHSIVQQPAHGGVVVNADGTVTYTPSSGFVGDDAFTYRVADGKGGFDDATVNVKVNDTNAPPLAQDDHASATIGASTMIDVLVNDTDPDNDALTITRIVDQPKYGTAEIVNGQIKYTPNADAPVIREEATLNKSGADLLFNISGAKGLTVDIANITSDAAYQNSIGYYFADASGKPLGGMILADNAHSDKNAHSTIPGSAIPVGATQLGFFIIANGDCLNGNINDNTHVNFANIGGAWVAKTDSGQIIKGTGAPAYFSDPKLNIDGMDHEITLSGNQNSGWEDLFRLGDKDFNDVKAKITVSQTVEKPAVDHFTYEITDGHATDTAVVTVDIGGGNTPPVASDDRASGHAGEAIVIDVLSNDLDPDGDKLTIDSIVTGPVHGTASIVDGKIVYTPSGDLVGDKIVTKGATDSLYDISGSKGLTIDLGNISTDAQYHNSLGYYFADASGKPIGGAILADDVHYDKSAKATIAAGDIPAGATQLGFFIIPNGKGSNWGIGDNMHVNFENVNGKWVAKTDSGAILKGAGADAYFSDPKLNPDGLDHEISLNGNPNTGWEDLFKLGDKDFNDVMFNATVTSKTEQSLSDSFEYKVSDGKGGYDTAKVTIDLSSSSDGGAHLPDAVDDCFNVKAGSTVRLDLLANDKDGLGGHDIDLAKISGYDVQNGSTFRTGYGYIKVVDADKGLVDFQAFKDCNTGKVKLFDYTIKDAQGHTDNATVSVNLESDNSHGDWWC
ncbi:MAG: Ig-like domain-containing protein [Rickettsiales bacterium]